MFLVICSLLNALQALAIYFAIYILIVYENVVELASADAMVIFIHLGCHCMVGVQRVVTEHSGCCIDSVIKT